MTEDVSTTTEWFKSSYSGDQSACVETRFASRAIGVRDSKDVGGDTLSFGAAAWSQFVEGLKGE